MACQGILQSVKKVIEFEANIVSADWPPICAGLIHQPKRPNMKIHKTDCHVERE